MKLELPPHSRILHVDAQETSSIFGGNFGGVWLWAEVDTEEPDLEELFIRVYSTGEPLDNNHSEYQFLNTFQAPSLHFVGHAYIAPRAVPYEDVENAP